MKINAELVVKLRKTKFWSQEELAIAAGLNLRTIQRIEAAGVASLQSRKALASAFDIEVSDLNYMEKLIMKKYEYRLKKYDAKGFFTGGELDLPDIESECNEMGQDGWELVSTITTNESIGATKWVVVTFRRPRE